MKKLTSSFAVLSFLLLSSCNPLNPNPSVGANYNPGYDQCQSFTDQNNNTVGFGGAIQVGTVWDATYNEERLNQTGSSLNSSSLDSSWAPNWSSLVSHWSFENNWNDSVGTNTLTPMGSPTFSSTAKIGSYSASFGGAADYAVVSKAVLGTQVDNWTISAWIFPRDLTTSKRIAVYTGLGGTNGFGIAASGSTAGRVSVEINNTWIDQPASYTLNTWQHVVAVRSGGTLTVYLNGIALPTTSVLTPTTPSPSTYIAWDGAYSLQFGYVDEVAIWSSALSQTQIQTVYTRQYAKYAGTLTSRAIDSFNYYQKWTALSWVPTLPFLKELPDNAFSETQNNYSSIYSATSLMNNVTGLWHFDEASYNGTLGEIKDTSGNNKNGVAVSGATTISTGKFGNSASLTLGQSLSLGATTDPGPNDFTVSAWVNTTQTAANNVYPIVVSKATSGAYTGFLLLMSNQTINGPYFQYAIGGAVCSAQSSTFINDGKWHHLVGLRIGNTCSIYVDGQFIQNGPGPAGAETNANNLVVGGRSDGWAQGQYSGLIDEVGLWSRALSSTEISQLYRRGGNSLRHQVRTCLDSACTNTSGWMGPDNTNQTYFSELYDTSLNSLGGGVLSTLPSMIFSNFAGLSLPSNRFFEYRTIMDSDDGSNNCNYGSGSTWCSPELKSVTPLPLCPNP